MAYDYSNLASGRLVSQLATSITTGVTLQADTVNTNYTYAAWPTGAHKITIKRKVENTTYIETCLVASATQSSTTGIVTLGTLTRNISATDGTDTTGTSATVTWPSGALVYVGWDNRDAQQTAKKDEAQTFTATQTFSSGLIMTATDKAFVPPTVTTTQRDAIASPSNGMIVYNSTTGVMNQYISGAWTTFASGSVSNAANNTGGKVDIATAAEVAAGTATDATSGSLNVIPVSIVKPTSTGAVSGSVPALNTSVMLDGTIGGIGAATPALGAMMIGAGAGLAMTSIGPSTVGFSPVSTGSTLAMRLPYVMINSPSISNTISATLGNATSATAFASHGITISANDLIAGVVYEFDGFFRVSYGTGSTFGLGVKIGSNVRATSTVASTSGDLKHTFKGKIIGTAAAGAAASVQVYLRTISSASAVVQDLQINNEATNGSLAVVFTGIFGTGSGGHDAWLWFSEFKKVSSTSF